MTENLNVEYAGPWADLSTVSRYLVELQDRRLTFAILGCEFPGQTWLFTVHQFIDGGVVSGLQSVCFVLRYGGGADRYRIADRLSEGTSFTDRERTVWDDLRDANTEQVLQAARRDADMWKLRRDWARHPPPILPDDDQPIHAP